MLNKLRLKYVQSLLRIIFMLQIEFFFSFRKEWSNNWSESLFNHLMFLFNASLLITARRIWHFFACVALLIKSTKDDHIWQNQNYYRNLSSLFRYVPPHTEAKLEFRILVSLRKNFRRKIPNFIFALITIHHESRLSHWT